jgi:hypothetical protein
VASGVFLAPGRLIVADSGKDKKKKKGGKGGSGKGGGGGSNVFDQGNELLLSHAESARMELGAVDHISPGSSMLSRAERQYEAEKDQRDDKDEAAEAALREESVQARDQVCLLMQQMMADPKEMQALASIGDRKAAAVQLIESLALKLTDLELDALAAYDHEDITYRMIISAEAYQEVKQLSAQALKFGAFATVLWELAYEQMQMVSMPSKRKKAEEEEGSGFNTEPTRQWMTSTMNYILMARSSDRL